MAVSVRSLVSLFISVFLSVVPASLSLAFDGCTVVLLALFFFGLSVCVFPLFAPPRSPSLVVLRFSWALS